MENFDRRSTFALGLATATVALVVPQTATAETYGPDYAANDGKEEAPGIRSVEISKRSTNLPGYKTVTMTDYIYQPGAKMASPEMTNDMVCHCLTGELAIDHGGSMQFAVKEGDVWSCIKGQPEASNNTGSTVAIMRVIDLLPS